MSNDTKTFTLKSTLTLTYAVTKCEHSTFNGEHTESFDLSTLTNDDLEQYLAQTLVIKRQSQLRSKTANEKVKVGTWVVPAPGTRIATSPESRLAKTKELVTKLTEAQKMELAKAMGFDYKPAGLAAADPDNAELSKGE